MADAYGWKPCDINEMTLPQALMYLNDEEKSKGDLVTMPYQQWRRMRDQGLFPKQRK